MQPEYNTWPARLAQQMEDELAWVMTEHRSLEYASEFLDVVAKLDIPEHAFQGKIGVIGQGSYFPERTLICSMESEFEQLKSNISLLTCFDTYIGSDPALFLDNEVHYSLRTNQLQKLPHGSVVSYRWGAQAVLNNSSKQYGPFPNNFFDCITAFRIQNLGEQMRSGLLESVARVLRPGGFFVGSGGAQENLSMLDKASLEASSLKELHSTDLQLVTRFGSFSHHVGFVVKKVAS